MPGMGRFRHLSQGSTAEGHFVILAVDHRANLREALDRAHGTSLTDAAFSAFKRDLINTLIPGTSAILTDPDFGLGPFLEAPNSGQTGLLMPLEVTDYTPHPSQRETRFIEGWSVEKIKRAGASGVKLLLYYHPEAPNASSQRILTAQVIEQCHLYDIPLFLEPITYSLDPTRALPNAELRQVVVENARTFCTMGIDVLKSEFPIDTSNEPDEAIWRAALHELNAACTVPWTLLSAGVPYEVFRQQTLLACQAGASGVIVGRAVWAEAVTLHGDARTNFLKTTGRARVEELAALCKLYGTAWRDKVGAPNADAGWYRS